MQLAPESANRLSKINWQESLFMFRLSRLSVPLVAVALVTAGCQSTTTGAPAVDGRAVGAALGAIGGGIAGTQVGSGRGRTAAIIGGTLLGGVLGAAIVDQLSPQGRQAAYTSTQQAMNTAPPNQPVRWVDPVNPQVYGTVTPITPAYYVEVDPAGYIGPAEPVYVQRGAPAPRYYGTSAGAECRDYQTAVFAGGRPETLTGRMCRRGPNEPWRPIDDGFVGI